ncbi:MAG: hypothetical protein ABGZ49_02130, partial [Akkermansiaceae bacterium]
MRRRSVEAASEARQQLILRQAVDHLLHHLPRGTIVPLARAPEAQLPRLGDPPDPKRDPRDPPRDEVGAHRQHGEHPRHPSGLVALLEAKLLPLEVLGPPVQTLGAVPQGGVLDEVDATEAQEVAAARARSHRGVLIPAAGGGLAHSASWST